METAVAIREDAVAGTLGVFGSSGRTKQDLALDWKAIAYIPRQRVSASSTRPEVRVSFAWAAQWRSGVGNALMSKADTETRIARYEKQFGMSSEEFLEAWRDGTAPDTMETMDWSILLEYG